MDEQKLVHDFYAEHAEEFDHTRNKKWSSVRSFINNLPKNTSLVDVGCGNGNNMTFRDDLLYTGCDMCQQLLNICSKKNKWNLVKCDIRNLPFENNAFDNSMSIAVIHHLSHAIDRLRACEEIVRITKPGGKIFIEVWSDGDEFSKSDKKFKKLNDDGDYIVMWKGKYERFYHMFRENEINKILSNLTNVKLIEKKHEANNWIIILEKI